MVDINDGGLDRLKMIPCPFCGSENVALTYSRPMKERRGVWFVQCNTYECNLSMGGLFYKTPEEAVEHWNIRNGVVALKQEYDD